MGGIPMTAGFSISNNDPVDDRQVVADITARNAIPSFSRPDGLETLVLSENKKYRLVGGITNSDWVEIDGGGGLVDITKSALDTAITGSLLVPGTFYKITDAISDIGTPCPLGLIVQATKVNKLASLAIGGFYNPDYYSAGDYSGISGFDFSYGLWIVDYESSYVNGDVVAWNNRHWKVINDGAFNGLDPYQNGTAYSLLSYADNHGYIQAWDPVLYDYKNNWICWRKDQYSNWVGFSHQHHLEAADSVNIISLFTWGTSDVRNIHYIDIAGDYSFLINVQAIRNKDYALPAIPRDHDMWNYVADILLTAPDVEEQLVLLSGSGENGLLLNGDKYTGFFSGKFIDSAGTATRQLKVDFYDGISHIIFDTATLIVAGDTNWLIEYILVRVDLTTIKYIIKFQCTDPAILLPVAIGVLNPVATGGGGTISVNLLGEATGTGAAAGDIVLQLANLRRVSGVIL